MSPESIHAEISTSKAFLPAAGFPGPFCTSIRIDDFGEKAIIVIGVETVKGKVERARCT